jgi:hypothetical protein
VTFDPYPDPWLLQRRGVIYDALHLFVNPNGYRLSDNVWRADVATRAAIDRLLTYEIQQGTAAINIAKQLTQYLGRESIARTKKPYGQWGSYDARRLARTEITAAAGRATQAAGAANPFVIGFRWTLSLSHPDGIDCNCEAYSLHDEGLGPGVYREGNVPEYPDHPH